MPEKLSVWETLMKRMTWEQIGPVSGKKILDFGSGNGATASCFARCNEVTAVEPCEDMLRDRWQEHPYTQLTGSTEQLRKMPDASFDVILCHNVLEYAADREEIVREFARLMKPDGLLSLVKHNRAGRVMQMAVLLNAFEKAHALLDGGNSSAAQFGVIRYFDDEAVETWSDELRITRVFGIRTFWDLQQNQQVQQNADWQEQMLALEKRVSTLDEYRAVAFFHHLLIQKRRS